MANKKEEFKYGSQFLPSGEKRYSIIRWGWKGINRSDDIETGMLSDCDGVTVDYPYIDVNTKLVNFTSREHPVGIFGFADNLIYIVREVDEETSVVTSSAITFSDKIGDFGLDDDVGVGYRFESNAKDKNSMLYSNISKRSMVWFNVATFPKTNLNGADNIVTAKYDKKLVLVPDMITFDYKPRDPNFPFGASNPQSLVGLGVSYPDLNMITAFSSRIFGVDDMRVYASNYNSYAAFDIDAADYNNGTITTTSKAGNAWISMAQSNTTADSDFTGIWTYDNHVVLFKKKFMQLVYNNKNPFRLVDVGSYGCDNQYAITETNGMLYFVDTNDGVYRYTGGTPKLVSQELDLASYKGAVLGSFGSRTYMGIGNDLYTYVNGHWSKRVCDGDIVQFASTDNRCYLLYRDGRVMILDWIGREDGLDKDGNELDTDDYESDWWFETDLMVKTPKFLFEDRRVKKFSAIADIEDGGYVEVYLLKAGEKFDSAVHQPICVSKGTGRHMLRALVRGFSSYGHRLRFVGHGKVKIHSCELKVSWGGETYVEE